MVRIRYIIKKAHNTMSGKKEVTKGGYLASAPTDNCNSQNDTFTDAI